MLEILKKPYPLRTETGYWLRVNFTSGLLVSLILFFILSFQNDVDLSVQLVINVLFFGAVTVISMSFANLLLPLIFRDYFLDSGWTVGKNIFWWLLLIVIISVGNTLCSNILYNSGFSLRTFGRSLYYTIGIGLIINTFFSVLHYKFLLKKHSDSAQLMNLELESGTVSQTSGQEKSHGFEVSDIIKISSENDKENFTFSMGELLFVESADNYSRFFCFKDHKLSDTMIRSSLKRVETQTMHLALFRCHRSYLVNLRNVASVSGNAQGYRLHFKPTDLTIPVSRNAGKELHEKLLMLNN